MGEYRVKWVPVVEYVHPQMEPVAYASVLSKLGQQVVLTVVQVAKDRVIKYESVEVGSWEGRVSDLGEYMEGK